MTAPTRATRVLHLEDGALGWRADRLAVEEPLEVRIDGAAWTVTMRTPGDDFDLCLGLLLAEGVVEGADDVVAMRTCDATAGSAGNVVDVAMRAGVSSPRARALPISSACGVCGRESIEALRTRARHDVAADAVRIAAADLAALPGRVRDLQHAFARTGGLHAAALADASGSVLCVREDVGRHNAVDKVVGWAATRRLLPLGGHVLLVSGRASFELTQKAWLAGIPVLAAVSAPSSLAVETARAAGMTLVGFVRGGSMNVYTGAERVTG